MSTMQRLLLRTKLIMRESGLNSSPTSSSAVLVSRIALSLPNS